MEKTYYFISGMPRSGSTLLANILCQNPNFHTTSTSGVLELLFNIRNIWDNLVEFKATPNEKAKVRVLKGIIDNFYSDITKPVIFDKSRGWLAFIETIEYILDKKVKILVPVRDVRDILASFEKLWRKESKDRQLPLEKERYFEYQRVEGRTKIWLENNQPVGLAYNRITDALTRGFKDRLHFVRFEDLTINPKETLDRVYKFLEEEPFKHDFENVSQVTWEDDLVHGIKGLHEIRPKVEPMKPQWPTILGRFAEGYSQLNIWD